MPRDALKRRALHRFALAFGSAAALGLGCRAIAGVDGDLTYAPAKPDAATGIDAHRDAVPDVAPRDAGMDATHADATHADATRGDGGKDARSDAHGDAGRLDAPPDVELPDATACPAATEMRLFTYDGGLGTMVLSGTHFYANIVSNIGGGFTQNTGPAQSDTVPYTGFVACPQTGCAAPSVVADYSSPDAALQWGSAAVSDAGIYQALASLESSSDCFCDGGAQDAGSISLAALDGGGLQPVVPRLGDPFLIALAADEIYWVDDPSTMSSTESTARWRVLRCPTSGCASPEVVMTGAAAQTYALFLDGRNVYLVANDTSSATHLYACALDGGCGGSGDKVLNDVAGPTGSDQWPLDPLGGGDVFATDGQTLFRASPSLLAISVVDPATSGTTTLAATGSGNAPGGIAVDDTYVYWSIPTSNRVQRTRKDGTWGGAIQNVVCNGGNRTGEVSNIAISQGTLYFETVDTTNVNETSVWSVELPP